MKKKKTHITQKLEDKYPETNVPVEDAWAAMKGLLDQGLPVSSARNFDHFKWLKVAKLISVLSFVSAGLYIFVHYQKGDLPVNTKVSNQKLGLTSNALGFTEHIDSAKSTHYHENSLETKETPFSDKTERNFTQSKIKSEPVTSPKHSSTHSGSDFGESKERVPSSAISAFSAGIPKANTIPLKSIIRFDNPKSSNTRIVQIQKSPRKAYNRSDVFHSEEKHIVQHQPAKKDTRPERSVPYIADNNSNPKDQQLSALKAEGSQSIASEKREKQIPALAARTPDDFNVLKPVFNAISVKQNVGTVPANEIRERNNDFTKRIHFGLLWNFNLPQSGYDLYFRGTGSYSYIKTSLVSNDFYKLLFPAVYLSKTLRSGSELLIKVKPYNQYFGRSKPFYNHKTPGDSTYTYNDTKILSKISGLNLGIQYNQFLTNRWSLGVGMGVQWQKNALIRNEITTTDPRIAIDYVPFISIIQKTDTLNYLNPHFITTNVELLYSYKCLQIGAGLVIPITSMTPSPYLKQYPISGQLLLRWRWR